MLSQTIYLIETKSVSNGKINQFYDAYKNFLYNGNKRLNIMATNFYIMARRTTYKMVRQTFLYIKATNV